MLRFAGCTSTTSPFTGSARVEQRVVADVLDVDELPQHQVAVCSSTFTNTTRSSSGEPGRRCTTPRRR
jgi:hypothetical protein